MTRLINIDNGGTLTDICVVDGDEVRYTKTLTTPFDLSRCLFDGLTKASSLLYGAPRVAALLQATDHIRYSTTQGTNALVQRRGPRLGLLSTDPTLVEALAATAAEEDLLTALVGARHTVVDVAADDDALTAELAVRFNVLTAGGASRVVVSIGGPDGAAQERRVKRLLLRLYPRHLLGAIPLLFSWELVADRDDVRRTWSGLLNAFLHPAMERFLFNTEQRLRDYRTRRPLLIFRNDGGSSRVAKSAAIKTYSSGPRGGLEGTRALARAYGFRHVLMADVGGTTTDIGVVTDAAVEVHPRGRVERVPTSFELAAITSHGVGGSSVIRVADGQIVVGPDSVGAAPGPACFGLGGTDATITDVYLLMGVLDAGTYLDGSLTLDAGRSRPVVESTIAQPLGVAFDEALALMEEAYLAKVAAALAFGIGYSDISQRYEQPLPDSAAVAEVVRELRERAGRDMYAEGVDLADCVQAWRLRVERDGPDSTVDLPDPAGASEYLWDGPPRDGELTSLELTVVAPLPHVAAAEVGDAADSAAAPSGTRAVRQRDGSVAELPVIALVAQPPGARVDGPAVIEGPFFTMRLPTGWQAQTTAAGDLLLTDGSI